MKRETILIFNLYLIFTSIILTSTEAQSVIIEAKKPVSKKAGRLIQLQEEWQITDKELGFYFKNPSKIKIAEDEHIFILDEKQFLEFSSDGRFMRNLFRSGEGPGEFNRIEDYLVTADKVIIHQRSPNKIVILDRQGNFVQEFRPREVTARLLANFQDKLLMAQHSFPQIDKIKKEEEILEVRWNFCLVSGEGEIEKLEGSYPTLWFFKRLPTAIMADYLTEMTGALLKNRYFVFSHTENYSLKILDLNQRKLVKTIQRKYKKVRYQPDRPKDERPGFKTLAVPRAYFNDIQKIIAREDKILVLTSTVDRKKGFLFDVFDADGHYLDNFYLPLHLKIRLSELARYPLDIRGDTLLMIEKDDNGNISLVKYRMLLM
jgi:hypothetical protein